jgi:hypothetical protein
LSATVLALAKAETITQVRSGTTALEKALEKQLHKVTKDNKAMKEREKALKGMVGEMVQSILDLKALVVEVQGNQVQLRDEHNYFFTQYDEHILEHKAIAAEAAAKSDSPQVQAQPENAGPDGDGASEAKRPRTEETTVASGSDRETVKATSMLAESLQRFGDQVSGLRTDLTEQMSGLTHSLTQAQSQQFTSLPHHHHTQPYHNHQQYPPPRQHGHGQGFLEGQYYNMPPQQSQHQPQQYALEYPTDNIHNQQVVLQSGHGPPPLPHQQ